MTILIYAKTGREAYPRALHLVLERGVRRMARGLNTIDAGMVVIELESPHDALPLGVRPKLSKRVAAAEAIQLIGGFHNPRLMLAASPKFENFTEPDGTFHGAYGNRVGDQVRQAVQKLRADPDTRQAVVSLWDPVLDNQRGKKDYPCTVALRFSLLNDRLELDVIMRSNDAWLGLPYDMFQFAQLQFSVANALGVNVGAYRHTTWSLHLYTENIEDAFQVSLIHTLPEPDVEPTGIGFVRTCDVSKIERQSAYATIMGRAAALCHYDLPVMTVSEEWYREQLRPRSTVVAPAAS